MDKTMGKAPVKSLDDCINDLMAAVFPQYKHDFLQRRNTKMKLKVDYPKCYGVKENGLGWPIPENAQIKKLPSYKGYALDNPTSMRMFAISAGERASAHLKEKNVFLYMMDNDHIVNMAVWTGSDGKRHMCQESEIVAKEFYVFNVEINGTVVQKRIAVDSVKPAKILVEAK